MVLLKMVNYKNSDNFKNPMDNSQRNGLIYLMLFIMGFLFLANFASAVNLIETKTDYVKQGDVYIVKQYCVNSTYANISFINLASQNILGQTAMIEVSDDNYQYNFTNTSILGIYSLVSYCDENGVKVAGGQDFEVTPNGKNLDTQKTTIQSILIPVIFAVLALILISISYALSSDMGKKSLTYSGIILAAFNLYLCFYLGANDLIFILSAGVIAFGVVSLLGED